MSDIKKRISNLFKESLSDKMLKEKILSNYLIDKVPLDLMYFNLYEAKRKLQKMNFTKNYPETIIKEQEEKVNKLESEVITRTNELEQLVLTN